MLDLNFVRDNLALVEEKLRQRGMKPSEVLKNFAQVDAQRRQAITSAETMQAQRNRASEEIAKLKKSGQDASALIAETKNLREQVDELGKAAEEYETRLRQILVGIPNVPHASVPVGPFRRVERSSLGEIGERLLDGSACIASRRRRRIAWTLRRSLEI